ncbi:four-carbon acid sugar kinase family protein [Niabella yanshanensis]|uniref:Four-carbon acid sugar kinase family protein n=1 Tax=Niabella yanshanensis TaxID=577386 RepID=A0ABZ0W6A9_9BACT|nr:four-carbon acid sugar kinase family protein [Niabella yanshanensis]WQD38838.1 four-carbon acid sugar kinase family protein [Niabella yanshanensis]
MPAQPQIQLAFYGDDFTGSTDALEFACRAGAKAILFIEPPNVSALTRFPGINVIGVAGKTRSLGPDEMEQVLTEAFSQLKQFGPRHIHYKVCSTFDSSPLVGSIGRVMDVGAAVFAGKLIPVLGGTPSLGRYCVFGNLFARMGIGSNGAIYRLDRHPSMTKHPVTPADESDLRLHIQKQTSKRLALIDIVQMQKPITEWDQAIQDEDAVLVDTSEEQQLGKIGDWLDAKANENEPLFSIGSSAVEVALGTVWNKTGDGKVLPEWIEPGKAEPLLVVSGSCSPVTAGQINWSKENGFKEVILNAIAVCDDGVTESIIEAVNSLLKSGKNVVVHTGSKDGANLSSEKLGTALGSIARSAVETCSLKRVVIAGGDTSSYAARAMQIEAVEMIAPLVAGAPLCKAYSQNRAIDGLEVNFKGGQVGAPDYFGVLREGRMMNNE